MLNKDRFAGNHLIRTIIGEDLKSGKHTAIQTRSPPEPNDYLYISHAKSACLNFGLAYIYDGSRNLRFDDTNPEKENDEYINVIREDVEWLDFHWADEPRFISNYFNQLYDYAVGLIKDSKTYVGGLTPREMHEYCDTLTEASKNSPYRDRSVEESLDLFTCMKNGEFPDGNKTPRLKIDMASGNANMRGSVVYRVHHTHHHNTGNKWCTYSMYDYTYYVSDAIEGITHSLCTFESEAHRPLYDWVLDSISAPHATCPYQYELSRLELLYSITSKRKLNQLVLDGHVAGWDDPRMPTISGMHHRGYMPEGLRLPVKRAGISKPENVVDMSVPEGAIREELENFTPRLMAVLNPLKIALASFEVGKTQDCRVTSHPSREEMGDREISASQTIYIEADDFTESPPEDFKRLIPGGEVRLHHGYVIKCDEVVKDEAGDVVKFKCSIDHSTLSKNPEGRKVKGVVHWVSAERVAEIRIRLHDRLFTVERLDAVRGEDDEYLSLTDFLNPESIKKITAYAGPVTKNLPTKSRWQLEHTGYFVADHKDYGKDTLVFSRTVTLKDSWQAK